MDLETCGFAGTPVFLIGCAWCDQGDVFVEQMFARTYEQEPAILSRFAELYERHPVLVTFNGKAFDWPFIKDRATIARRYDRVSRGTGCRPSSEQLRPGGGHIRLLRQQSASARSNEHQHRGQLRNKLAIRWVLDSR